MRSVADLRDWLDRRRERVSCHQLTEQASDHLDGALPRRDERRVLAHLRRCAACRRFVDQLRVTIAVLARLPHEPVDEAARRRLVAQMRAGRRP